MGSKQNAIAERRLRHVYDFLDAGYNKKAIQEADKVLKKHPDTLGAKALKALGFIRLQRVPEAWDLLEDVEKGKPNEEHILQAMTHCYKDLQRPDRITVMYEDLCQREATNEEFHVQLFMSYARAGNEHKKQQQTAMTLYRLKRKNLYYFWNVMSCVMQGYADAKLGETMLFPLAQKMVQKMVQSDSIQNESEVLILLLLFEKQSKYSEALELLQSGLAEKFLKSFWDKQYRILEFLCKLEHWEEAITVCVQDIPKKPDDWRLYSIFLDSVFALISAKPEQKSEYIETATNVILDGIDVGGLKQRAPYLARLKLIIGLLEREFVVRADLGEPMQLLIEYFTLFGHKPCCFTDMQPFLCLLGEQQQDDFLDSVWRTGGFPLKNGCVSISETLPETGEDVEKHLCCLRLSESLGRHSGLTLVERGNIAVHCVERYHHAVSLEPEIRSSEMRHGDSYLMIATQLVWDIFTEQADSSTILSMIIELEQGLEDSPVNFNFKLALLKLYSAIGATGLMTDMVKKLDIKYVQKESLNYLVFDQHSPFGSYHGLLKWLSEMDRFFHQTRKEIMDCIAAGYKTGNLQRLPELAAFDERIQRSANKTVSLIAANWFRLLTEVDWSTTGSDLIGDGLNLYTITSSAKEEFDWSQLRDNRDFDCFPSSAPTTILCATKKQIENSFQETIDVARFRHLILRIFGLLREFARGDEATATSTSSSVLPTPPSHQKSSSSSSSSAVQLLKILTSQLKAHQRHCQQMYSDPPRGTLQGPMPSNFHIYLQGGYFDVFYGTLELVTDLIASFKIGGDSGCVGNEAQRSSEGDIGGGDQGKTINNNNNGIADVKNRIADISLSTSTSSQSSSSTNKPVDFQHLIQRMLACHQVGSTGGTKSPAPSPHFPYMQLVHLSNSLQTLGLSLLLCSVATSILNHSSSSTSTPKSNTNPSAASGKKSGGGKKNKNTKQPHTSGTGMANGISSGAVNQNDSGPSTRANGRLNELINVLSCGPGRIAQLIGDLQSINSTDFHSLSSAALLADSNSSSLETSIVLHDPKNAAIKERIQWLKDELRKSYGNNLTEMSQLVTHQQKIADSLLKSVGGGISK